MWIAKKKHARWRVLQIQRPLGGIVPGVSRRSEV